MHAMDLPRQGATNSVGGSSSIEDAPLCLPWSDVVDLYCHDEDTAVRAVRFIDELQLSCCADDDQFVRRYFAIQSYFGHQSQPTTENIDHATQLNNSNNNNNCGEWGGTSSNDDNNVNPLLQDCMWCHPGLLPDPVLLRSGVSGPLDNRTAAAASTLSTAEQQRVNIGVAPSDEELLQDALDEEDDVMDDVSDDGGGEMTEATTEDASETEEQCCSPGPPGVATAADDDEASVIARIHNYSSRSRQNSPTDIENVSKLVSTKPHDFFNSAGESISVRLVKVSDLNDSNLSATTVGGLSQQGLTHTTPPTYATSWMLSDNANTSLHNSGIINNNNNNENERPSPRKDSTTQRQLRRHMTSRNTNRKRKSPSYQRRRFDSVESVSSVTSDGSEDWSPPAVTRRRLRSITHNILERERRCRMRSRFAALRACLPNAPRDKRASNATVLRLAVQHVRRLALTTRRRETRLRRLREVGRCLESRLMNVWVENGPSPSDLE